MLRRSRRAPSQRRKWTWDGAHWFNDPAAGNPIQTTTVGNAHQIAIDWIRAPAGEFDSNLQDNVEEDCTLMRMLIASEFLFSGWGNGFTNTAYAAMGVIAWDAKDEQIPALTAIPFPSVDVNFDWVWRWVQPIEHHGTTQQFSADNQFGPAMNCDVRSRRKLSHGTGLLFIADLFEMYHGANYNWTFGFNCRIGMKKP